MEIRGSNVSFEWLQNKTRANRLTAAAGCSLTCMSLWPPDVIDNKQTLHKSGNYSTSINACLVSCHRSANFSLLITPPVISLTPCQPFPNPWYKLYSWHYGRDHLSTQRAHAVLPVQTAWLVGHPWLAVWSVSVKWYIVCHLSFSKAFICLYSLSKFITSTWFLCYLKFAHEQSFLKSRRLIESRVFLWCIYGRRNSFQFLLYCLISLYQEITFPAWLQSLLFTLQSFYCVQWE